MEACGLLAGRDGRAIRAIRCRNIHETPITRYRIDPREQLHAFREMDDRGEDLVAIYHSHPVTEPKPSDTDRRESYYPDAVYVLVSLRSGEPEIKAWRIAGDGLVELALG